jgi:hypothetical protein
MFRWIQKNRGDESYATLVDQLISVMPALKTKVACPACPRREPVSVSRTVVHLNDDHLWSREAIADWLDSLDVDLSFPRPRERQGR